MRVGKFSFELALLLTSITLCSCAPEINGSSLVNPASDTSGSGSGSGGGSGSAAPITTTITSGAIGTVITVTSGTIDLTTTQSVTINGVSEPILSTSTGSAEIFVNPGTTSGAIVVDTTGGSVTLSSDFTVTATGVPSTQQGSKLVGTSTLSPYYEGYSSGLSADGNTAIIGGYGDNGGAGAAWIFTRSGTTWTQQAKLVGAGALSPAYQGWSVGISADGNTAVVGGPWDNTQVGAAWIFTRSGTTWTQQAKLVGTGYTGASEQGTSVAISGDGNTVMIGGPSNATNIGAAWVFTRSGSSWSQQGSYLVGVGGSGSPYIFEASSVALSFDGNTAVIGGYEDSGLTGAIWIFTRSGTTWSQQGTKLVGTGATGGAEQGTSVAISADGNTVLEGGETDNSDNGAAWVFTRSGTTWSQQGSKLVGDEVGYAGCSVALSADGNTAVIGVFDALTASRGGAWVYTRSGGVWTQNGDLFGTGAVGSSVEEGFSVALSADGSTAIIGARDDNSNVGAAWVFVP